MNKRFTWNAGDIQMVASPAAKLAEQPAALLPTPDVPQDDDYSCGACASMAVGLALGVGPQTLEEWKKLLGTDAEDGTPPDAIVRVFTELGCQVQARQLMTLADLQACWQAGQRVICPIQDYGANPGPTDWDDGHYVVVVGLAPAGYVAVQDSSDDNALADSGSIAAPGKVLIPQARFLEVWHDQGTDGRFYLRYGIAISKK